MARNLADTFLGLLAPDGVPHWFVRLLAQSLRELTSFSTPRDFDHPRPTARDASAGMSEYHFLSRTPPAANSPPSPPVAAGGLLKIYSLLRKSEPEAAEEYLRRAHKLVEDTIKMCMTPRATRNSDGTVDFGAGGWETLLMVRSLPPFALRRADSLFLAVAFFYQWASGRTEAKLGSWTCLCARSPAVRLSALADASFADADYYFLEFGNEVLKLRKSEGNEVA